jgi:hypothetical protein
LGSPLVDSSATNVFNGRIYPGLMVLSSSGAMNCDHLHIIDWYYDVPSRLPGSDEFVAGINWSIVCSGSSQWKAGNYTEQEHDSKVFGTTTVALQTIASPVKITVDTFEDATNWQGQHADLFICGDIGNAVARLTSHSDGYLWQEMSIPQDASYLTFDLKVETPQAGDFLTVSLGNEVIYYKSLNKADSNFWTVDPIFIGDFAGQTKTLLFTLNHVSDVTSSILLDNITLSATVAPADLNIDGKVNFTDYAIFANYWMYENCAEPNWCEGTDFDHSGSVDIFDLATFAEYWLSNLNIQVADLDMDGKVNFADYAIFAHNWMDDTCSVPNWCEGTDFDHNGSVDIFDLATFARYWLEGI